MKIKNPFKSQIKKDDIRLVGLLDRFNIDVVLDVGANVGQYATSIRRAGYQRQIISFEPLSSNIEALSNASAKDSNWDIADRMAIGATQGEVEINISENNDMSSILDIENDMVAALPKSTYVGTEMVTVNTIDSMIDSMTAANNNVFLKVDTQGFEYEVIQGAMHALKSGRIKGIQLELSLLPLYKGERTYNEICADIHALGFQTYQIIPGFFSKNINRQLQADFVFFKG